MSKGIKLTVDPPHHSFIINAVNTAKEFVSKGCADYVDSFQKTIPNSIEFYDFDIDHVDGELFIVADDSGSRVDLLEQLSLLCGWLRGKAGVTDFSGYVLVWNREEELPKLLCVVDGKVGMYGTILTRGELEEELEYGQV